ncbi:hypothetical protein K2P97_09240 [bacterium]|nr:hypothetical protein [bacterium]
MNQTLVTIKSTVDLLTPYLEFRSFEANQQKYSDVYQQVLKNRKKYYLKHAPHLLAESEIKNEMSVDQQSKIISVSAQGQVIASLRLTPRPYELETHDSHNFDFENFKNYLEIGRLVTDPEIEQINLAILVRYLLCGAGLVAFEEMQSSGFVAICRPYRLQLFKKFGLQYHFDIFSQKRKIQYCFLSGSASEILSTTAGLQTNEEVYRKRLERLGGRI